MKAGISKEDFNIIVKNIIADAKFKDAFLKDPEAALRKVRHELGMGL
ncbi:MAG: hypothetical protein ACFFD2_14155 [Promethearchaeota archaeon]